MGQKGSIIQYVDTSFVMHIMATLGNLSALSMFVSSCDLKRLKLVRTVPRMQFRDRGHVTRRRKTCVSDDMEMDALRHSSLPTIMASRGLGLVR